MPPIILVNTVEKVFLFSFAFPYTTMTINEMPAYIHPKMMAKNQTIHFSSKRERPQITAKP